MATAPLSPRHERLWSWFASLGPGVPALPQVEVWPRGGAKSATGELGCAYLGQHLTRRFVLYVCGTQEQADLHVQNIAGYLERIGEDRALNKYGNSKGWKRQQLRTANGFNVAAYGLDAANRGVKIEQYRPDLIIFDDVDDDSDTKYRVRKKERAITTKILPAGSADCNVLFLQNLIHDQGVVARLVNGKAAYLNNRVLTPIEPAVKGLTYEIIPQPKGPPYYKVTGGIPTWEGQNLAICEWQINSWGIDSFLRESQHEVANVEGALWDREWFTRKDFRGPSAFYKEGKALKFELPEGIVRIVIALDPTVSDLEKKTNPSKLPDACGLIVAGIDEQGGGHVLGDFTKIMSPAEWARMAIKVFDLCGASVIVAEANQGGELIREVLRGIASNVTVQLVHAATGKRPRAEPVVILYEQGRVKHYGPLTDLEDQMVTWDASNPGSKSPNNIDALVWAFHGLGLCQATGIRSHDRVKDRRNS